MRTIFIIFSITALYSMQSASAIKCFKCQSWIDANCDEKSFNSKANIFDCDTVPKPYAYLQYMPVTKCNKLVSISNKTNIQRGCHFEVKRMTTDSCDNLDLTGDFKCHICEGNLCNGYSGTGRLISLSATIFIPFILIYML